MDEFELTEKILEYATLEHLEDELYSILDDETDERINSTSKEPSSISLEAEKEVLLVRESTELIVKVTPFISNSPAIIWETSDPSVITVLNDGTLVAKSIGTATITAISYPEGLRSSIVMRVSDTALPPVLVSGLDITVPSDVYIGRPVKAEVDVLPEDATNKNVMWESSDPTIATVDSEGNITGVKEGTVTITVTASDGSGITSEVEITIKPVLVESLSVPSPESLSITTGTSLVVDLEIVFVPSDATNKNVTITSSSESTFTVVQNSNTNITISGLVEGTANLIIKTADGSNKEVLVPVNVIKTKVGEFTYEFTEEFNKE